MRIYEGAPRQNYEDILRSVGAILDQRGMREVTVAETDDGFMVQGLAVESGEDKSGGFYEAALRVIGSYADQQQPRDVFFFEQERQFVMRLLTQTRVGLRHVLVEFTREEVEAMITNGERTRPPG